MRKSTAVLILSTYFFSLFFPCHMLAQNDTIRITKIKDNHFAINKGSNDGIAEDDLMVIVRNEKTIGKARVALVRENASALSVISLEEGATLQIGDRVIRTFTNEKDILEEALSTANQQSPQNYYYLGQRRADLEYSGAGAIVGGLVSGTLLGLIGWGLGYAIMSSSEPDVPPYHLSSLNSQQQFQFSSGYIDKAKSKRNGKFHAGAAIGTLVAVIIVLNTAEAN
ncbi:hypothetical protein GF406_07185 [candidate division KSB1 bacterium]|nr:hypothetical protein [candidate division KSB1 bacterium]